MPLDTCITNVGEYYSSHYLDSTFAGDVKELIAKWNERGSEAPPRRLQNLAQYYFRAKTQVLDEELPIRRQFAGDEARGWHSQLLSALGYTDLQPLDHPVEGGDAFVPTLGRVNRYNQPWLVVCETHFCLPDSSLKEGLPSEDPLGMEPCRDQLLQQADHPLCSGDWSRCVGRVFTEEDAPRWILLLAGSQLLLLDRNTFAQGRFLSFDLDDAFGRREKDTFNHIAAFLSAQSLCPDGESNDVLLDKLEEQSHKFAHGVTENLQFAVREAIELLVNEWARDRVERQRKPLQRLTPEEAASFRFSGSRAAASALDSGNASLDTHPITAEHLRREALTFVYRLLFCFYAEARGGELEILPVDDTTYRLGYSLESLRDLELVPLTDATAAGTYFHQHLRRLFQIIHSGFHPGDQATGDSQPLFQFHDQTIRAFEVRPLTATLFSPDATPLLNRAELSNRCLQEVIRYLSLSKDDRSRTIGRVNYAELGINQLGAVYEGLLSYKGMFADSDLIHVKPKDKAFGDKKTPTWFVPRERLEEFERDEVERLPDGRPRIYRRGEFILHLNGIDREQSASYYTPEVLTKCLVEEALRELLKDYTPADADKILELKICEPAMGSGAFLNEAAEQLAARYLELKQKQLQQKFPEGHFPVSSVVEESGSENAAAAGKTSPFQTPAAHSPATDDQQSATDAREPETLLPTTIEPGRYGDELRRVKHYIAVNNIYGVDLNETAVELGQLSLWLGSIHRLLIKKGQNGSRDIYRSGATPWFGLRLRCGNSLIGARRSVWTTEQLKRGEHAWDSKLIQQVQSDIEALQAHTTPEAIGEYRKEALDLVCKIKWAELAEDPEQCRAQVVRFCECARERNTDGLIPAEKSLYEKQQTTWKWVSRQKDQDALLSLFDLLPKGRIRDVERISFEIFQTLGTQHADFKAGIPRLLKPGTSRGKDEVYHFLVFDPEMVPTRSDSLMKSFWKEECAAAGEWVKKQVTPRWKKEELDEALAVCTLIDEHWRTYASQRVAALNATACTATVWPVPSNSPAALRPGPTLAEQERICRELESTSGSFQRLRLVMDTWCSLWFWPLDRVTDLPSRDAFLASARVMLSGERPDKAWTEMLTARLGFEIDVLLQAAPEGEVPDTELLAGAVPWLGIAETIRAEQNFHHWELIYLEILGEKSHRNGFSLILGNPPWFRVTWSEGTALAECEPHIELKNLKGSQFTSRRSGILATPRGSDFYFNEMRKTNGVVASLNCGRLYPVLQGMKTNLYKAFIALAWRISYGVNASAYIHPEGTFDDPSGSRFRREMYKRLRAMFQFENELNLFTGTNDHGRMRFLLCVYGTKQETPDFTIICNLYHPKTIANCWTHKDLFSPVPGIKTNDGRWNTEAHRKRIVKIGVEELSLFRDLLESDHTQPTEARLLQVHSQQLVSVIRKLANFPTRLIDARDTYYPSQMLNETTSQEDGEITKCESPTYQPLNEFEWILSGPHFFVGNPLFKTARTECTHNNAYDRIDLTEIPEKYLPKAKFRPGNLVGNTSNFESAIPKWPTSNSLITSRFRYVNREMVSPGLERTLVPAIIPPGTAHLYTAAFSLTFNTHEQMTCFATSAHSIAFDFLIKLFGKGHCQHDTVSRLPLVNAEKIQPAMNRALRLNAITNAYSSLWCEVADPSMPFEAWSSNAPALSNEYEHPWSKLCCDRWEWLTPLRTEFSRRQALVEIDVLVAMALGLELDELISIYRVQFPLLRWYDSTDRFDRKGRYVPAAVEFKNTRKIPGTTEFREAEAEWVTNGNDPLSPESSPLTVSWEIDDGLQTVTKTFYPPFTKVDREADYARAWEVFSQRYAEETADGGSRKGQ